MACDGARYVEWRSDSGEVLQEVTNSQGHCGWESVSFLYLEPGRYVADPEGAVDPSGLAGTYDADATLPPDARFTGFTEGDRELWAPAKARGAVYVVTKDRVERWPEIEVACD